MLLTTYFKDTIKIQPQHFGKDRELALKDEINRKYANKVLPDVGLCVSLFDIEDSSEGIILHGDGCIYHKVVFKPSIDEALLGRVGSSSREGIKFTLGFFDDCWIPEYRLPQNCAFDPTRSEFYWVPPVNEEDSGENIEQVPEEERFYIIAGETIRVRVVSEVFSDTTPKVAPKAPAATGAGPAPNPAPSETGPPPYRIECSIAEPGLGLLDWWSGQGEGEELAESGNMAE
ncbi:MAG: DNA-directed RNA polymerase III subunit rpc25 [Cyphobasidiales sp. Tagirdzhanova-0007]|nr:MAG: DNA-directed RNA polymerase III subunit rpc25 [Cyphobasidiales sp. Tagirdzhanova-0007]